MTFDAAIRNQITDLVTQTIEILLREQVALPNVIEMRVPHMPPSVLCYSLYETDENVTTIIGNNKVFSDSIQNFSSLPVRRVDCTAKVANSVDVKDAMTRLRTAVAAIPNVAATPAPDVEILHFTPEGPLLCVRPYCHTDHYWQVYFDTHKVVVDTFGSAGYPVPETPIARRAV